MDENPYQAPQEQGAMPDASRQRTLRIIVVRIGAWFLLLGAVAAVLGVLFWLALDFKLRGWSGP